MLSSPKRGSVAFDLQISSMLRFSELKISQGAFGLRARSVCCARATPFAQEPLLLSASAQYSAHSTEPPHFFGFFSLLKDSSSCSKEGVREYVRSLWGKRALALGEENKEKTEEARAFSRNLPLIREQNDHWKRREGLRGREKVAGKKKRRKKRERKRGSKERGKEEEREKEGKREEGRKVSKW